jgi:hypothetical protein
VKLKPKPGLTGWVATAVVILAAELLDEKTMSDGFKSYSRSRKGRFVVLPAWAFLTAHLFGVIPSKNDPLCLLWAYLKGVPGAGGIDTPLQLFIEEA